MFFDHVIRGSLAPCSRGVRWLSACAAALALLVLARTSSAQELEQALTGIASDDRERLGAAIVALGALENPRAGLILKALDDGQLRIDERGQAFITSGAALLDARTGQAASPSGSTREPPMNNRVRKNLTLALAQSELRSADADVRLEAAEELSKDPAPELASDMRAALQKEQSDTIRELLRVSLASLDLVGTDIVLQKEALLVIQETSTVSLIPGVRRLAKERVTDTHPEVRELASSVLASLERRVFWVSTAANLFYNMFCELEALIFADAVHFATQAVGEQTLHSCGEVKFDKPRYHVKVNFGLEVERCDHHRHKFFFIRMHNFRF